MNVAVVQLCSTQDIEANHITIERFVREAAAAGARFVALPENTAFLRTDPSAPVPAQTVDGPIITRLRKLAGELGIWLLVGSFPETSADPARYHNTSVLLNGTAGPVASIAAVYRKMHLFDIEMTNDESQRESDIVAAGTELVCTDIDDVKVGLSICYDLRFPTFYQRLVDRGARILTVPSAFTEFTGKDHWLVLLRARAIETQTFVVAPDQSGYHGGKRRSYGKSVIIDPWGTTLCIAPDGPGWAMARLDFDRQDAIRTSLPCLTHRHPRAYLGETS